MDVKYSGEGVGECWRGVAMYGGGDVLQSGQEESADVIYEPQQKFNNVREIKEKKS